MKQKLSIAAALAVTLVLTAGIPVSAADGKITSFHGYEWGTSLEDIQEKEVYSGRYFDYDNLDDGGSGITEDEREIITNEERESDSKDIFDSDLVVFKIVDMRENITDEEIWDFSLLELSIMNGSVAGNNANVNYLFADGVLDAGFYRFILGSTFEERELIRKYNEVYGDPVVLQDGFELEPDEVSPPESFYAWNDDKGNVIIAHIFHDCDWPLSISPNFTFEDYSYSEDIVAYFNGNGELWPFICSEMTPMAAITNMDNIDGI